MQFDNPHAGLRGGRRASLAAVALASAAFCAGAGAQAPVNQGTSAQASAKGRILVQARAGLSDKALAKILGENGGGRGRRMGRSDLHIIDLQEGAEQAMVARLSRNPHVKFAEVDRLVRHDLVANDPYLGSQWHLATIKAGAAWDLSQGSGITIAILDSGVLPTHPDLVQVAGWNFFDNNANTADANGHGTAVAGAAAAMANNGAGVAGVAGAARIMPLRVSDAAGYAYYSTIASAVTFAADNGARVANASFGGVYASASVQSAANYFKSKGGLLVVSAGNSGANDGASVISAMIPVSATDSSDLRASWSSFGNYVALSAPGVGIWTTSSDGTYRAASGTSFSAPITAGVAALVMAAKPSLTSAQVENLLYATAQDLGTAGRDIYFGHGRVDASAAVIAAAGTVAVDTQAPAVSIAAPLGSASVSGLTTVDVSASDNVGVTKVVLQVNGNSVATDTASPFQFSWDTAAVCERRSQPGGRGLRRRRQQQDVDPRFGERGQQRGGQPAAASAAARDGRHHPPCGGGDQSGQRQEGQRTGPGQYQCLRQCGRLGHQADALHRRQGGGQRQRIEPVVRLEHPQGVIRSAHDPGGGPGCGRQPDDRVGAGQQVI